MEVVYSFMEKNIVLYKYWHQYCGPCKVYAPIVEEVVKDTGIAKVDVNTYEAGSEVLVQKKVNAVPLTIIEVDGQEVFRKTGIINKPELTQIINSLK